MFTSLVQYHNKLVSGENKPFPAPEYEHNIRLKKGRQLTRAILILTIISLLFTGCNTIPSTKPSPTPEPTSVPTKTSTPTAQPSNTPTSTPTEVPTPTPTLGPPPITGENFLDHLEDIQDHIFGYLEVVDLDRPVVNFISQESYEENLESMSLNLSSEKLSLETVRLHLFNLSSVLYKYENFFQNKQKTTKFLNGGVYYEIRNNEINLVENYSDTEMQLAKYVIAITTYVLNDFLDKNSEKWLETGVPRTHQENDVFEPLVNGLAFHVLDRWLKEHQSPEATIPEPLLDRSQHFPGFVPEYFLAKERMDLDYGMPFVAHIEKTKGLQEIYKIILDLPEQSSIIAHPESYPDMITTQLVPVDLRPELGEDWQIVDADLMGEIFLFQLLAYNIHPESQVDVEQAKKLASSWGNDFFLVYSNSKTGDLFVTYTVMVKDSMSFTNLRSKLDRLSSVSARAGIPAMLFEQPNQTCTLILSYDPETFSLAYDAFFASQFGK